MGDRVILSLYNPGCRSNLSCFNPRTVSLVICRDSFYQRKVCVPECV